MAAVQTEHEFTFELRPPYSSDLTPTVIIPSRGTDQADALSKLRIPVTVGGGYGWQPYLRSHNRACCTPPHPGQD